MTPSPSSHAPPMSKATSLLILSLVLLLLLSNLLALVSPHGLNERPNESSSVELLAPNGFQANVVFVHDPPFQHGRVGVCATQTRSTKTALAAIGLLVSIVVA